MFSNAPDYFCVYDSHHGSTESSMEVVPMLPVTFGAGTFACAQELRALLEERGCDVDQWGITDPQGRVTKTVSDLWEEIEMGECDLRVDQEGVRRQLNVVKVRVRRPDDGTTQLVETSQIFSNGGTRKRGLPLSEKMFPGEAPTEAAERGIVEELGSAISEQRSLWPIEVEPDSLIEWAETRRSQSYPDLLSHYLLFQVRAAPPAAAAHDARERVCAYAFAGAARRARCVRCPPLAHLAGLPRMPPTHRRASVARR